MMDTQKNKKALEHGLISGSSAKRKTLVSVNLGNYGSTGTIMREIGAIAEKEGYNCYCAYPISRSIKPPKSNDMIICSLVLRKMAEILSKYTGFRGIWLVFSTWNTLRKIKKHDPTIIHLHNLHNTYINLPMLFRYIKKHNISTIWTLHDCWSFTGRCPHFGMAQCGKWQTGCGDCPYPKESYPQALVDKTAKMWKLKKKWFTGVKDMTIVTPSRWLADLAQESYLHDYPVKVIYNGIDLNVFKPTEGSFRRKYKIENKYIILGVAFSWGAAKGLDVFIELSKRLDEKEYQIVLVGTNDSVDEQLPDNIISVHRTQDQKELAEIYTAADLFVNPTREEVLGLVNIEALACGTPVVTFNSGGSPECIDETCGSVVSCDDIDALENEIIRITKEKPFSQEACLKRAEAFDQDKLFREYVSLYEDRICF